MSHSYKESILVHMVNLEAQNREEALPSHLIVLEKASLALGLHQFKWVVQEFVSFQMK